jgi:ribosomal protein L7/L12
MEHNHVEHNIGKVKLIKELRSKIGCSMTEAAKALDLYNYDFIVKSFISINWD